MLSRIRSSVALASLPDPAIRRVSLMTTETIFPWSGRNTGSLVADALIDNTIARGERPDKGYTTD